MRDITDDKRLVSPILMDRLTRWSMRKPVIALMGEFSAGKSTLMNLLMGADVLPTRVTATRLPPVWLRYGTEENFRVDAKGKRHPVDLNDTDAIPLNNTRYIRLHVEAEILKQCDLIDTPGISDPNIKSKDWIDTIRYANSVMWCTHSGQAWRESERSMWVSLPERLRETSILLVTRKDKLRSESDIRKIDRRLEREAGQLFNARIFISLIRAIKAKTEGDDVLWDESGAARFTDMLAQIVEGIYLQRSYSLTRYELKTADSADDAFPITQPGTEFADVDDEPEIADPIADSDVDRRTRKGRIPPHQVLAQWSEKQLVAMRQVLKSTPAGQTGQDDDASTETLPNGNASPDGHLAVPPFGPGSTEQSRKHVDTATIIPASPREEPAAANPDVERDASVTSTETKESASEATDLGKTGFQSKGEQRGDLMASSNRPLVEDDNREFAVQDDAVSPELDPGRRAKFEAIENGVMDSLAGMTDEEVALYPGDRGARSFLTQLLNEPEVQDIAEGIDGPAGNEGPAHANLFADDQMDPSIGVELREARAIYAEVDAAATPRLARALETLMAELDPAFADSNTSDRKGDATDPSAPAGCSNQQCANRHCKADTQQWRY